jgi:hypothetical protein
MINRLLYILAVLSLGFSSCEPNMSDFEPRPGNADFSVVTSIGCNYMAGFANQELYKSGQMVSIPHIITRQMMHVGAGEFKQPLMKDELGLGRRLILQYVEDCTRKMILWPVQPGGIVNDTNFLNIYNEEGPFHNMGVPGAKIHHITGKNIQNPQFSRYFSRFNSSSQNSVLDDAVALKPTFIIIWTGIADLFDYALTGGTGSAITSEEAFENQMDKILSELTLSAGGGILATLPDIIDFPFINHIKPIDIWVADPAATQGKRLIDSNEKVLLPMHELIKCENAGSFDNPVPLNRYLSLEQISLLRERTSAFNLIIRQKANDYNLALIDMNALFKAVSYGVYYEGIPFSPAFITGGFFSLDGYTLTRRANAIVANAFIEAINARYKSTIPKVSITQYQGIEYP